MAKGRESADVEVGYRGSSAPPVVAPEWRSRLYIDRPSDLRDLAQTLSKASVLAIDAEFMQLRIRNAGDPGHRLALLQFAIDDNHRTSWVVDTLRLYDLSPLREPLESPSILKLFHGISADARMLATRGLVARHYLDLEAVSRSIFGQSESGLQSMLQRACGVRLDKSLQRAEWGRRPLTMAMIAYAARDAQMTYVLYGWLRDHYPWAVDLHEMAADEPPPQAADWLRPFLDGGRGRSVEMAVAEAGLSGRTQTVTADLRAALAVARHPVQRVRLFRIVGELGLKGMADDLRPYLASPASEERASTSRALGRLHDAAARPTLQALTTDPVEDVRVAAHYALDHRVTHATGHAGSGSGGHSSSSGQSGQSGQSGHSGGAGQPIRWTSGDDGDDGSADAAADDWRARLRAQFPQPSAAEDGAEDAEQDGDDNARASGK